MVSLFRFFWKVFILASVFGVGYIIGREHSFEEDEEWDNDEDSNLGKPQEKKSETTVLSSEEKSVTFEYDNSKAEKVSVVGDFNDWNKDKNPMQLEGGVWKTSIPLKKGRHEYKFVINGTDWITDPKCSQNVPDKYGGKSSVIEVA